MHFTCNRDKQRIGIMSALLSENRKEFPVVNNVGSLNTSPWRKFSEVLQTSALWN